MKYCCLCCLVFAKFCFVGWFLRVSVLVRTKSFLKKKINKLEIVLITSFYYTTDLRQLWALPWLLLIALLFHHIFTTSATVLSGHFLPRCFLPYAPSQHLAQPAFIKASLGAGSSSLKVAGPPTEVWNIDPAHLFVWITQRKVQHKVLIGRFCLRVTTGRLMKNHL